MPKPLITPDMADYIREHYLTELGSDMAVRFGIAPQVVTRWMRKHGLAMPKSTVNRLRTAKNIGRTRVTPQQDAFIRDNYLTMPQKRIASTLGFSETCLKIRLRQLGLAIPKDVRRKFAEASQIKPGNVPLNKGKKQSEFMSPEAIERTKATRFKKGNIPPQCYNEVGKVTVRHDHPNRENSRPYKYICLKVGLWRPLHVHNWERVNGPVPKGHCLWFKDENTMNCEVENLELITRKENMMRNQLADKTVATRMSMKRGGKGLVDTILRDELLKYPEIIDLKRKQLMLQREIKNKNR